MWFLKEYKLFSQQNKNKKFEKIEWFPCLKDNLKYTPLDPTYFFQDSWAAKHLFHLKPEHHYDVGSSAKTMGILSQFVPITMVDIRPIELKLDNLYFKEGSILALPFEDNSIETLSSLCVVEHIGLGRYGDELDQFGSEKAIKELKRVLKIGGIILFSVPVDTDNKIYFNAHRAFTRNYILELFNDFRVLDEKYHYGTKVFDSYDSSMGFGTGLYMLKRVK
ncbi:MAG TPA: DUF268 domain-containing protein [Methylophaga sp.]|nr:DUF268 domain-containing protein [Methylophaga sp.]